MTLNASRAIEATTNHDVKAVEYFIRERLGKSGPNETSRLKDSLHFGCTSEDINNLSYALMLRTARNDAVLPPMRELLGQSSARKWRANMPRYRCCHGRTVRPPARRRSARNLPMLPPDSIGRRATVSSMSMIRGKFNGAVGNFNAHVRLPILTRTGLRSAEKFVASLGRGIESLYHAN